MRGRDNFGPLARNAEFSVHKLEADVEIFDVQKSVVGFMRRPFP